MSQRAAGKTTDRIGDILHSDQPFEDKESPLLCKEIQGLQTYMSRIILEKRNNFYSNTDLKKTVLKTQQLINSQILTF